MGRFARLGTGVSSLPVKTERSVYVNPAAAVKFKAADGIGCWRIAEKKTKKRGTLLIPRE